MRTRGGDAAAGLALVVCLCSLLPGRGAAGTEEVTVGEVGESILLVCRNVSEQAREVDWFHGVPGSIPPLVSSKLELPQDARLSLVDNTSLRITELRVQDEGNYTCKEVLNQTAHEHRVQLLVASGPSHMTVTISPSVALPNGTRYVEKYATVVFNCTSNSRPKPTMGWTFHPPSSSPEVFTEDNSSSNYFILSNFSPSLQGNYTCSARNALSGRRQTLTKELLVYYPPQSVPRCWAQTLELGLMLQLFCSWAGGYPPPVLQWREEKRDLENSSCVVNTIVTADTRVETLNSSRLFHGKEFKCVGSHIIKTQTADPTCTVQITIPSLEAEPLKTCFVGGNVTLTCRVTESNPPAKITWLRSSGHSEAEIQPGKRHHIMQEGSVSSLTIQDCSHSDDEGYYLCKAQNPVGLREVYVCLTVKKPVNIVGVVGMIVVLLLLGILVISGIILYYNPLLCLRGSVFRNQDSNDVLVLVDSEAEDKEEEEGEATSDSTVHQVTALVNGNGLQMGNGYHITEGDSDEQYSKISSEETEHEERPIT